MEEKNKQ